MAVFADRDAAGLALVAPLRDLLAAAAPRAGRPVLLPLPRGGVPVAVRIAEELHLPVRALPVRKVPVPGHRELAMGALAQLGDTIEVVRHRDVIQACRVSDVEVAAAIATETQALRALVDRYESGQPPADLQGRAAVVVDDGLATGATMTAAVRLVRRVGAGQVIAAVPVGASSARQRLTREADAVVCLREPVPFSAVSVAYRHFAPPSDDSVTDALRRHAEPEPERPAG
jgi:putative phosphoribosyl transferase